MLMTGLSGWLLYATIFAMVSLSLSVPVYLESRKREEGSIYPRRDILQIGPLRRAVTHPAFPFWLRLPVVIAFLLILFAGFFGIQIGYMNVAPILTWTIWWAALIFLILFLGKIWCLVCPWNAIAEWVQHLALWGKRDTTLSLNLRWPKALRNIYMAASLFVGLTWLELGFGITIVPWATAGLGLLILMLALVPALYFERKPFCRYGCLVGRVSGLYALFSPVELRSKDKEVCHRCHTKDCLHGNDKGYGCPVYEYVGNMDVNADCILCTECLRTCPYDNIAFNVRPPATDLVKARRLRPDEAYLALVVLSLTSLHGVTMTPAWSGLTATIASFLGGGGGAAVAAFTLGMGLILAMTPLVCLLFARLAATLSPNPSLPLKRVFIAFAYPLLPLALFYHLAHNSQHLFLEGQWIIPLASDPLGLGWNLLGTAYWQLGPVLPLPVIQPLQLGLLLVGLAYALLVAHRIYGRLLPDGRGVLRDHAPLVAMLLVFSLVNLWLLTQPMMGRMGM
ncbi:MAG: 4Fe-4S binding protein [Chloroflexi bacterium]|nr:4Fe-4S binding protein [Chloroflexota bacterium]